MKKENLNFLWSQWSYILEIEIFVMLILFSVLLPLLSLMLSFHSIFALSLFLVLSVTIKYGRNPGLFFALYTTFILLYSHYSHFHILNDLRFLLLLASLWGLPLGLGAAIDIIKKQGEELKKERARGKELERKLLEREKKYRTIVENADEVIFILSLKGEILYVNKAQERNLGFQDSFLIKKSLLFLLTTNEEKERAKNYLQQLKKGDRREEITIKLKSQDEKKRIFECRGKILTDSIGKPEQILLISSDITEKIKKEEKIQYLSYHDSLTGLYNRHYFEEEIKRLDAERQLPFSIIMGDINGLKLVNDAFGHHQGDILIQKTAAVLQKTCRKEDCIARWGGDEFVLLLPNVEEKACQRLCQRIEKESQEAGADPIPISISLGYATKHKPIDPVESAIKVAEDLMYQEKLRKSQKARFTIFQSLEALVKSKSYESEVHIKRIQSLADRMGEELDLTRERREDLFSLIQLHDIGMSAIEKEIIMKEGPLSLKEWRSMKEHPIAGYHIARSLDEYSNIAHAILAHHERIDGRGYPKGLKGEEIPFISRIMAIIDAYDVMTTGRPHREALEKEEALRELVKGADHQFDKRLVDVFLRVI